VKNANTLEFNEPKIFSTFQKDVTSPKNEQEADAKTPKFQVSASSREGVYQKSLS
jgi:hypothetical protein